MIGVANQNDSPLVGFNNNVKHNGRVFHIQTEDSGVRRPHLITHLFADGGRIVKSLRTDYTEHLERPDRVEVLRQMMKEQHKAMFIQLRGGQLDELIRDVFGSSEGEPGSGDPAASLPEHPDPGLQSSGPVKSNEDLRAARAGHVTERTAARAAHHVSGRLKAPRVPSDDFGLGPRPEPATGSSAHRRDTPPIGSLGPHRYAAARPAHIFAAPGGQRSLFGEVAEQSLDDVILGYLSDGSDDDDR